MSMERTVAVDERLATDIADLLGERTVASCESFTAGRVAAGMARAAGASGWLRGAVVSYQESVKRDFLGVTAPSVYSEAAAVEMAASIARILDADVAVATTGVAGNEPMDGVEPGTAFIATRVDGDVRAVTTQFEGSADEVCSAATTFALGMLRAHLAGDAHIEPAADESYVHRREMATEVLAFDSGYD